MGRKRSMVDFWSANGDGQSEWMPLYAYIATAQALEVEPGALLGLEAFERDVTAEQRVVLDVIERLGLSADEAIARLALGARPSED